MRKTICRASLDENQAKVKCDFFARLRLPLGFKDFLRENIMEVREGRARNRLQRYLENLEGDYSEAAKNARTVCERLLATKKGDFVIIFIWCRMNNVMKVAEFVGSSRDKVYAALSRLASGTTS